MSTFMKFRLTPIYALVLTVMTYMVIAVLPASYLTRILTERGPLPYVIVFLLFTILGLTIIAQAQKLYAHAFIFGLFGLSLTPVIVGLIGTVSGFSMSLLGLNSENAMELIRDTDLKTAMQSMDSFYTGVAHCADTTLLGLFATLITWSTIAFFCVQNHKKHNNTNESD